MTINKYRGNNLRTAISKARAELGPEAKIIHVRQLDKYSVPGARSSDPNDEKIEIIVAADGERSTESSMDLEEGREDMVKEERIPAPSARDAEIIPAAGSPQEHIQDRNITTKNALKRPASTYEEMFLRNLEEQIPEDGITEDIHGMDPPYARFKKGNSTADSEPQRDRLRRSSHIREDSRQRALTETHQRPARNITNKARILQALHKCCSKNQVNTDIMYEIFSLLDDERKDVETDFRPVVDGSQPMTARDYMSYFISMRVNISSGLDMSRRISIFIGPTGVGKTTTLAKLAAQYRFQQRKAVGLITIDAYRIAAIDQLKTYSQIMSIPLKVALTPEELEQCISDYEEMDLILVDTPGRSPFNTDALNTLQEFLEAAQPADTHLLVAVSTREDDACAVADNFAPQYVRQLIFTKLDETSSFGPILNINAKIGKPVSYLTTGQNVPDDIEAAQVERMADLFMSAGN